jgi:NADH-quinone oxidoreductase subunit E
MIYPAMDNKIAEHLDVNESSLISMLQRTQKTFGYIPEESLKDITEQLNVPLSRVYGVATFYTQFRFTPLGKYVIKICHGNACHVTGSENISQALEQDLGIKEGETTEDGLITLERVACLGCCSLAPTVMINDKVYGKINHNKMRRLVRQMKEGEI